MRFALISRPRPGYYFPWAASVAATLILVSLASAQEAPKKKVTATIETPWSADLKRFPGLLPEFEKLYEKLKETIQYPSARTESHLATLLPESTDSYAAICNFNGVIRQTLKIFRQERQESAVLNDWWQHGQLTKSGPEIEESLEKLAQLQDFLGEEIVVSGSAEGKEHRFIGVAEVRKPGLKKFLLDAIEKLGAEPRMGIRVYDLQELATAKEALGSDDLLVLVRPDYVVVAGDLATLQSFNEHLERKSRVFASTAFGQKISSEYKGGLTLLAAGDLQKTLDQIPSELRKNESFQRSGFADVKYLVWEHKNVAGRDVSQTELSFSAPRSGPAAWLAKSRPLRSLDFVSRKAVLAVTVVLEDPGQIFEDVKRIYSGSPSSPFASLEVFEKMLSLKAKDDLVDLLGGEITVEMDTLMGPRPKWEAALGVRDAEHMQKTLTTLLTAGNIPVEPFEEGGVTYYDVKIPSSPEPYKISYAFAAGHLIVGSSRGGVAEALRLHKTGESLGKSKTFLATLPPGHALEASAMLYEDSAAMAALRFQALSPEIAEAMGKVSKDSPSLAAFVYGDERTIREASSSGAFDIGAGMVVAAVAIPNLMRSRMAANETDAVGSLRTVNTAQATYASLYEKKGFATDLAKLGMNPQGTAAGESPEHAQLIDKRLANASCSGEGWCLKSGYNFRVTTKCKILPCKEYVAVATPSSGSTGMRNFCTTSDAVIRYKMGSAIVPPASATECKAWMPLK